MPGSGYPCFILILLRRRPLALKHQELCFAFCKAIEEALRLLERSVMVFP